jgi:hypothetical protein
MPVRREAADDGAMGTPGRTQPPTAAAERDTLTGFLAYQRETLAWKCSGLTGAQLRERAVPPSELSLIGLVRHMARVERSWFSYVLNGEKDPPPVWETGDTATFAVDHADPGEALAVWRAECERSVEIVAAAPSLDVAGSYDGETFSLRYILAHMIEEYARHNGHADLLRERLDGATGE